MLINRPVCLLLALSGGCSLLSSCSAPGPASVTADLKSWQGSLRLTAHAWLEGTVGDAFLRQMLQQAQDNIGPDAKIADAGLRARVRRFSHALDVPLHHAPLRRPQVQALLRALPAARP